MNAPLIAADPDALVRALVRPGEHVHLAGTPSRPNALTHALCRVLGDRGHLTVSTTAVHSSAHALALSGVADKVIAGFAGDTYPSPRPNPLYERLPQGEPFAFEAWSLLSYVQRLIAGATGAPYAATGSLAGTDLAEDKPDTLFRVPDPADPRAEVTLAAPLRPDVTLIHAVAADEDGNLALVPPLGEGAWAAYAAKRGVVASVERIVSREELRAIADRVLIPGTRVLGLCEAPMGAHPQALRTGGLAGVTGYRDDYAFLEEIVDSCHGPERGRDWYRTWVEGTGSHEGYLNRLGCVRLAELAEPAEPAATATGTGPGTGAHPRGPEQRAGRTAPVPVPAPRAPLGHQVAARAAGRAGTALLERPAELPAPAAPPPPTRQERLIVLGAREVAAQVRAHGYDTLLAGIGSSHMAAWLAADLLRDEGRDVKVTAELGMYGFTPQQGDVFLFSLLHAAGSEMLAGIPEILGGMVAANPRALGVLAAAEIDGTGTINTSVSGDGRWLTGSGGANDIASSTDCVVIAPSSRRRYVERVAYRTSPGHRVKSVVSDFGRFVRDAPEEPFRLATWLSDADPAEHAPEEVARQAAHAVATRTGWNARTDTAVPEEPVTERELAALRALDPDGRYR
ncbi:hypothetical protein GCM10009759_61900 [Kitasatospora saccharophila]|uniref:Acyl CoA:acetate/3-ketoacid CoA transferase alpha subunit n=2 Tax=Kitasatospora saccharophila TaxID=407973 RepID=A0ABP5JD28_9ACTN